MSTWRTNCIIKFQKICIEKKWELKSWLVKLKTGYNNGPSDEDEPRSEPRLPQFNLPTQKNIVSATHGVWVGFKLLNLDWYSNSNSLFLSITMCKFEIQENPIAAVSVAS